MRHHHAGLCSGSGTAKDQSVKEVVSRHCREKGAELIDVQSLYKALPVSHTERWQNFSVEGLSRQRSLQTSLLGMHQIDNALTAVACADVLRARSYDISEDAIARGITWAAISGRLERLSSRPFIVVDGAHNEDSAQALVDAIRRHFSFSRCFLVIGTNADKNVATILRRLKSLSPHVLATKSDNQKATQPDVLLQSAIALDLSGQAYPSVAEALDAATRLARPEDLICVTGSLYVVGEAREHILAASGISPIS